jgi:MAE_28990/MAE_18760-like HEPN
MTTPVMPELASFFEERFEEIESYLMFLQEIEDAARSGPPRIQGASTRITASQQKILYSSVYLQLYNLVEATVSRCIKAVTDAATSTLSHYKAADLNASLRQEWVRAVARTHIALTPENRLKSAMIMCKHLIDQLPVSELEIEIGGGGNWDDESFERISARVGCELEITAETRRAVKQHERDDLGAMKLVKDRRNNLAHGSISFVECGEGLLVEELRRIAEATGDYLREAILCYLYYIELFSFLEPHSRPAGAA